MARTEHYEFTITVNSYVEEADEFKAKNNLTWDEVGDHLRKYLQTFAWADAFKPMQDQIDWENSKEGKKWIAEFEASRNNQEKR